MTRPTGIWAVAVACALGLLGGCSEDSTPPREFMAQVCDGLGDWFQSVSEASGRTQRELGSISDAARGRSHLTAFFDTLVEKTDLLISEIEEAGIPEVQGGQEAADRILQGLTDAREALDRGRRKIPDLPDDPAAFRDAAAELRESVRSDLEEVGGSLRELNSSELKEAARQVDSCRRLGSA
ncbi:MAG: hypothetical protein M3280_10115 [Actinomycetota bacterium]|nr:hypothetical protein [Actinomycetota bacterium]